MSEAVITHDIDVNKLIVDLAQKAKDFADLEESEKAGKPDWSLCFRTVIFVVKQKSFVDCQTMHTRDFFGEHKLQAPP